MLVVRPAGPADFDSLMELAVLSGRGFTSLPEDEATLKRIFYEDGHVRLQPENSTMAPIIVENATVLGKLVALFRMF